MTDVFISYSRSDADHASRLVEHLRQCELDPWLDTDDRIPAGERWRDEVQRAIETAGSLLVLVTPAALDSGEVLREIEHAELLGKPLIPIILSVPKAAMKTPPGSDSLDAVAAINYAALPNWLSKRQPIDARDAGGWQDAVVAAVRKDHQWRRLSAEFLDRARRWSDGVGSLLSDQDLIVAQDRLVKVPPGSAPLTALQLGFVRASGEAQQRRLEERADRLADQVLAGFYDPDLEVPLAVKNIQKNTASARAVLALDRALRQSHIDGRPRFAKPSIADGKKVRIAAIDPDFRLRHQPLSLMECAGRFLYSLSSFSLPV
jgi:hypothetical protein